MAIDPRIPTAPGRSLPGFDNPGRHSLHQAHDAVSCFASSMKGELRPTKNPLGGGRSCISITASID